MKKIIMGTILLITANATFCQQNNPSPILTKQDYMKKSKHQKTAGWILMGGGILSTALGSGRTNPDNISGGDNSRSTVFLVTGLTAIGVSIPLFIASSKNKKKAADISFRMDKTPQIQQGSFVFRSYPAISFRINL